MFHYTLGGILYTYFLRSKYMKYPKANKKVISISHSPFISMKQLLVNKKFNQHKMREQNTGRKGFF